MHMSLPSLVDAFWGAPSLVFIHGCGGRTDRVQFITGCGMIDSEVEVL